MAEAKFLEALEEARLGFDAKVGGCRSAGRRGEWIRIRVRNCVVLKDQVWP
jgi:hypothetical protein